MIQNCELIFRKFIDPQIRNTLVMDILGFSDQALDSEDEGSPPIRLKSISYLSDSLKDGILKHLGYLHTSASTLSMLTVAGITYSVASKHSGNSCILLQSSSKAIFLPAQIEHIVQFVSNNNISVIIFSSFHILVTFHSTQTVLLSQGSPHFLYLSLYS